MLIPINIAVEDELSECVVRRLLSLNSGKFSVGTAYRKGGFGYLRKTVTGWNRAAPSIPFILLTDLDTTYPCPPKLIEDWLGGPNRLHPNLLFRVAVREVEAWLLADREGIANFLGVGLRHVPEYPEGLPDPKAALIGLARRARTKDLRMRLVPKPRSTATQGPEYNECLCEFVQEKWDTASASKRAPSLSRAIGRLARFRPQWPAGMVGPR